MDFNPIALFRFECIQSLLGIPRGEQEQIIQGLVGQSVIGPNGRRYRLSRASLLRWLAAYRQANMEGLIPKRRKDRGRARKMDFETAQALLRLKQEHPTVSVPGLIHLARTRHVILPGQHLPRVSVYRLLKNNNLLDTKNPTPVDRRRFEAEFPMDLVQADVMHGPKVSGKKAYLIALIDDHSRLILWAEFRWNETAEEFISVLKQALLRRGLPRRLYVDNGSAFRSDRLAYSLARLGIALCHSTPYQPEGKGKCERWFKTIRQNFLPQLSLRDTESLNRLNEALHKWIDDYYHQTEHTTTGQTPWERFVGHLEVVRKAPDHLEKFFRHRALRRVGKDRVVSFNGRGYEAPPGTIGKKIELRYSPDQPDEIEAYDEQTSLGYLKAVLPHSNCKIRRGRHGEMDVAPTHSTATKKSPTTGQVPFASGAATKTTNTGE
jgi:transposase InsO family protein